MKRISSVREGWLSILQDRTVLNAVASAGREIAFVPSWFARVENRRQEFGDTVQGDFHVRHRSSACPTRPNVSFNSGTADGLRATMTLTGTRITITNSTTPVLCTWQRFLPGSLLYENFIRFSQRAHALVALWTKLLQQELDLPRRRLALCVSLGTSHRTSR